MLRYIVISVITAYVFLRCGWTQQSDAMLQKVEETILSHIKTPYDSSYVDIGNVVGENDKIWTISLNKESKKTPLVLIHGMGAGLAMWCPNLDALAATRPVYAIDLLGFGRSSRPKFDSDPIKTEEQWVESIEAWRRKIDLDHFILLGHSLGGFLSSAYSIKYPERVRHLILADPWGLVERPSNVYEKAKYPLWVRVVVSAVEPLNPMWAVRAAGPAGKWLVRKTRPDIPRKFVGYVDDAETVIPEYIYQCNSQTPSGESAFHALMNGFGWSKNPIGHRVDKLDPTLPITVLYGATSWVYALGDVFAENRNGDNTFVQVLPEAGHHVYLDQPKLFNEFVVEACLKADRRPVPNSITSHSLRLRHPNTSEVPSNGNVPSDLTDVSNNNVVAIS